MSASEIIEQIKTLPAIEQKEVVNFVQKLAPASDDSAEFRIRYATKERVKEVSDKIFAENEWVFRKLAE